MPVAARITAAPSAWVDALAQVAAAVAAPRGIAAPAPADATQEAKAIAASLLGGGRRKAVLLGNTAAQHPQSRQLLALATWIGEQAGATVGYFGESGNSVGAQLVGALPGKGGLHAGQMLSQHMKALFLLGIEPEADSADAAAARQAMQGAGLVVSMTPFKDANTGFADVLLPVAPFTETGGTFVNAEGRVQGFHGVVKPLGDTRPAWKVLRVLGNLLGLPGFEQDTVEEVRAEALGDEAAIAARLDNSATRHRRAGAAAPGREPTRARGRRADLRHDPIVRRAPALQATADAAAGCRRPADRTVAAVR